MLRTDNRIETLDPHFSLKPIKLLLVTEDNADYLLAKALLNKSPHGSHYLLDWCSTYTEAINAMLKKHHDLYLVDYKLGRYSGIDLLHEAICSNCSEPIIILGDRCDSKTDADALRMGARDYLVKESMDAHTLERSIRYALEHNIALKNLKGSENKFRTIFERSTYPIIISDQTGKIYDANPAAVKFFELPIEKLLLTNDEQFYLNRKEYLEFLDKMENDGGVNDLEVTFRFPNGKEKFCSISSFMQISQHGTTILYHSIIHDLTAKKAREVSMAEKIFSSEQIAKSLAAEIRDPLSNVHVALAKINSSLNGKSESLKNYLEIVQENFDRIGRLTENLFHLSDRSTQAEKAER